MSDVEIKMAENRASASSTAKSRAGFQIFFDLFSKISGANKFQEETQIILDTSHEDFTNQPVYCSIEFADKDNNNDPCSYLYYTVCLGAWLVFWSGYVDLESGAIYFLISAIIGIYLNAATKPKIIEEMSSCTLEKVCTCNGANWAEAERSQLEIISLPGPSTGP